MKARWALKSATEEHHGRVDRLFSRLNLAEESDYRHFLIAQAAAHLPAEAALEEAGAGTILDDWPSRRRSALLVEDLHELGAQVPEPVPSPALPSAAAVLGALYVLEGSRLGGAMLKRSLPAAAPRRFLAAEQPPDAWRKLLAKLDESLYDPARVEEASDAARQLFLRFEAAGRRVLES